MNILVVDDEPVMRDLLGEYLRGSGHAVLTAANGQIAWDTLSVQRWPADVVLADIMMPVMNGHELLRRMREAELGIPLVLLSGQININQDDALQAGASGIIHKPFNLEELESTLTQLRASPPNAPCPR